MLVSNVRARGYRLELRGVCAVPPQELLVHCWAGWRSLSAERSEQRQAARAEEKRANEQVFRTAASTSRL
eukprot:246593-Pleurochrysis_carterae.AAC.1